MSSKSYSHFFSKKFQHICVSLDVNFNELLTNEVVSFEQLGPGSEIHVSILLLLSLMCPITAVCIANSVDPDQTLHYVASDLVLHYLPCLFITLGTMNVLKF